MLSYVEFEYIHSVHLFIDTLRNRVAKMQIGLYSVFSEFHLLARILPSFDVLFEFFEVSAQVLLEVWHRFVTLK